MKYLMVLLLIACAPKKNDDQTPAVAKGLTATWTSTDPWVSVNLGSLGSGKVHWYGADDEICESDSSALILATPNSTGSFTISGSIDVQRNAGQPSCAMFDGTWEYSFMGTSLVLCQDTPTPKPCIVFN